MAQKIKKQIYPEPVVGAFIFNKDNRIFLMNSPKWKGGKYVVPGGHIEIGETAKKALRREIKEETNLNIFNIEYIGMKEFVCGKDFYTKKHFIFLDYFCRTKGKKVILDKEEATDYIWVSIEEALKLPLGGSIKKGILNCKEKLF